MGVLENIRAEAARRATRRNTTTLPSGATADYRWLQRYAAGRASGSQRVQDQGLRHLRGVGADELDAWYDTAGDVAAEEWLARLASGGPIAARKAAMYRSLIGERKLESAADLSRRRTVDSISRGAGALEEQFMGYGLDTRSPSVQAALAGYAASRGIALSEADTMINERLAAAKAAARAGALTPQALVDMGDTVFALGRLEEEEERLDAARKAHFYGQIGSFAGGMVGGPVGAQVGYAAGTIPFGTAGGYGYGGGYY